ncbi:MAG: hypothetical protein ACM3Q4_15905 [Acidobacteriota bacterium]
MRNPILPSVVLFTCLAAALFMVAASSGCKKNNPAAADETPKADPLKALSTVSFAVNDFAVKIDSTGTLGRGYHGDIFTAGLWIAAVQDGEPRSTICWSGSLPSDNYTSMWGGRRFGVYHITRNTIASAAEPWPVAQGFALDAQGKPVLSGDEMCWVSLVPDTSLSSKPIFSHPLRNLRISATIYGYQRADLRQVLFVRYDITNVGESDIADCYLGYYSDTDLEEGNGGSFSNSTAYDSARGISYTYSQDSAVASKRVVGFAALETPKRNGLQIPPLSHRIMRKNDYINPEFGEKGFTSSQQVLWALQGLDNFGNPMINPLTKAPTKFAFTGNPAAGSGWLDKSVDVRSMISYGPFPLKAHETQSLTIVWIGQNGSSIPLAIKSVYVTLDDVRAKPSLWQ